jgi:tetratricopeptide (TPR) repeat protein
MSEGKVLQSRGIQQYQNQDYEAALETFQAAFQAFQDEGEPLHAAEQQVNMGLTYRALEKHDEALEQMQAGLASIREHGDRRLEAQALGNMALVYARQDNDEQAATMYREAATIFRELKDDENYGETILALGDLQFRSGKMVQAVASYEVALDYIKNPNQRQKMMKGLLVAKNRLLGQQKAAAQEEDGEGEESDRRRRRRLRRSDKE